MCEGILSHLGRKAFHRSDRKAEEAKASYLGPLFKYYGIGRVSNEFHCSNICSLSDTEDM